MTRVRHLVSVLPSYVNFLGLRYNASILDKVSGKKSSYQKIKEDKITSKSIDKWRKHISSRESFFIDWLLNKI